MQSSEITQIVVTVISTVGAVLCARFGKKEAESRETEEKGKGEGVGTEPQRFSKWIIGVWICILIAVVNSGFLAWRFLVPEPSTEVEITYPLDQSRVEQTNVVRGTSQAIPADCVIWVVVFPQEVSRYYPQNYPADTEAKDNWSTVAYIGVEGDVDKKFDILATVVDEAAQDAFNAYLADARDKSDWLGLTRLPEGAIVYDRVSVTRK